MVPFSSFDVPRYHVETPRSRDSDRRIKYAIMDEIEESTPSGPPLYSRAELLGTLGPRYQISEGS